MPEYSLFKTRKSGYFEFREEYASTYFIPKGSYVIPPVNDEFENELKELMKKHGASDKFECWPCI